MTLKGLGINMSATPPKSTIWSYNFTLLLFINILINLGQQMLTPNMAKYMAFLGAAANLLGMASSIYALAALLTRPVSGPMADRFDKKKMLNYSLIGMSICTLGYCFTSSILLLLVLRFLHGVFFGFCSTLTMAIASQSLPEDKMTSGIAVYSLSQILAMAIAPTIGIYLIDTFSYGLLFMSAAALVAGGTALSYLIRFETASLTSIKEKQPEKVFNLRSMISFEALNPTMVIMMNTISYGTINSFMVLYGNKLKIAGIGTFFTVYAVSVLILRPLVSKLLDTLPIRYIVFPGGAVMMASFVLISMSTQLSTLLIAAVLFGIGNGITQPALQALALKSVAPERRGVASGTIYMGMDLGMTIGPALGGVIADVVGYQTMYLLCVIPIAIGFIIFILNPSAIKSSAKQG